MNENLEILDAFLDEARELVEACSSSLLALEQNPHDMGVLNELFRSLHTIKGVAGCLDLLPMMRVVHRGEEILDEARESKLVVSGELADDLLEVLDLVNAWLDVVEETEGSLPEDAAQISEAFCERLEKAAAEGRRLQEESGGAPLSEEELEPVSQTGPVGPSATPPPVPQDAVVVSQPGVIRLPGDEPGFIRLPGDGPDAAPPGVVVNTGAPTQELEAVDGGEALEAPTLQAPPEPPPPKTTSSTPRKPNAARDNRNAIRSLRVSQEKIDVLMDLVGELIVAKNSLSFMARKAEESADPHLSRDLKANFATINRISEELQNAVMQVRMVPVAHAFGRLPRMVRDLSRKLGKQIRLDVIGDDTQADKNIVEDLNDPLLHLLRNSIDHGVEMPDERARAGKSTEARITLRASQGEGCVLIDVMDDGRGIDAEVIKAKAVERELITAERASQMSHDDALQLIFAPGFSTAETVSDISGRGVGMDVVRSVIERTGSTITVQSVKGEGTHIQLSLPQSMKVSRVMVIEVGGERFGVPIEPIVETVRLEPSDIHLIKNREMIVLRDRLMPLFWLRRILQQEEPDEPPRDFKVLVAQVGNSTFGLAVDRFLESIDIILKPLEGMMSDFEIYAGTALLGDGKVLLVFDLKSLLEFL
jgi:chemotaxis protein histidine kinase CheA